MHTVRATQWARGRPLLCTGVALRAKQGIAWVTWGRFNVSRPRGKNRIAQQQIERRYRQQQQQQQHKAGLTKLRLHEQSYLGHLRSSTLTKKERLRCKVLKDAGRRCGGVGRRQDRSSCWHLSLREVATGERCANLEFSTRQ